jgi:nucleoside-diphosphate-sugar epimerase
MKTFVTGGSGFLGREMIRALIAAGHSVRAIARSEKSAAAVKAAGAEPVSGDLDNVEAMRAGMQGCDWVFHCAAHTEEWDTEEAFNKVNVQGTQNTLEAARAAGVKRFVLISSEAVLADGRPIIRADESRAIPADALPGYPRSKGLSEQLVRAASAPGFDAITVRPRLIWGRGDTANLVKMSEAVDSGRMKWVAGGRYLTSTTHVANVCEGALLAAEKGQAGEVYFLSDGEPVEFRWFWTCVMKTQQRQIADSSVPRGIARLTATLGEAVWRTFKLKGAPPVTWVVVGLMGHEVTVVDAKARRELGYAGKMSIQAGLDELAKLPPVKPLPTSSSS